MSLFVAILALLFSPWYCGRPTVLCKIVGVYQIGIHDRITGKRSMEQVAVMQNIFYNRKITRVFDLKGSLRGRFAAQKDDNPDTPREGSESGSSARQKKRSEIWSDDSMSRDGDRSRDQSKDGTSDEEEKGARDVPKTLLDGDFLEFTHGRPMPMTDRAKALFQMSILNVSRYPRAFSLICATLTSLCSRTLCSFRSSTFSTTPSL